MRTKQYEDTEDFKARIAALRGPKPQEDKPCVRKPSDRGYYPPSRRAIQAPGQPHEEPPPFLSKWWKTESAQKAIERSNAGRRERIQKLRENMAARDAQRAKELEEVEDV